MRRRRHRPHRGVRSHDRGVGPRPPQPPRKRHCEAGARPRRPGTRRLLRDPRATSSGRASDDAGRHLPVLHQPRPRSDRPHRTLRPRTTKRSVPDSHASGTTGPCRHPTTASRPTADGGSSNPSPASTSGATPTAPLPRRPHRHPHPPPSRLTPARHGGLAESRADGTRWGHVHSGGHSCASSSRLSLPWKYRWPSPRRPARRRTPTRRTPTSRSRGGPTTTTSAPEPATVCGCRATGWCSTARPAADARLHRPVRRRYGAHLRLRHLDLAGRRGRLPRRRVDLLLERRHADRDLGETEFRGRHTDGTWTKWYVLGRWTSGMRLRRRRHPPHLGRRAGRHRRHRSSPTRSAPARAASRWPSRRG